MRARGRRVRYVWAPLALALIAVPLGFAYVHLSRSGPGSGLYSRLWAPEPVQGYWDPDHFYKSVASVQGNFENAQCVACHEGITPGIVTDSRASRHAEPESTEPIGCPDCHGNDHQQLHLPTPRVCGACHAPRYVTEQLAAGTRLTEIARAKVREAEELAARHPEGATAVSGHLESIRRHLANVRLGAGHQSPDFQWWHGQPALDGDLIRLRHTVAHAMRRPIAPSPVTARSGDTLPENATPNSGRGR